MSLKVDVVEGFLIALRSLRAHRLRTVLTTVGVGIGVATLLAIVGIIQGLNSSFDAQLASLGSNSVYVSRFPWVMMGNWWEFRNRKRFTLEHADKLSAQCSQCDVVVPILNDEERDIEFMGKTLEAVPIVGSSSEWPQVSTFEIAKGRFLTESDNDNARSVVVIGADVAQTLFPLSNPVGASVLLGGKPFTVVGTLGPKGAVVGDSQDYVAIIPFQTFKAYFKGRRSIDIGILVKDHDRLELAEEEIAGILRAARATPPDKPDDFAINKPDQLASTYQQLTGALYGIALGIGLITLLVGGIGIMNIMLVSVRERTREIGVRRALGARKRTIVVQFVLEASLVSAVGGMVGTAVGLTLAKVISYASPLAATVKPVTVVFGVGFAALVGLIFGLWPAVRAADLDPVEALRNE